MDFISAAPRSDLSGCTALVAGAGSGICLAIAVILSTSGARILSDDPAQVRADDALEHLPGESLAQAGDASVARPAAP